jgi:hypothetical protein
MVERKEDTKMVEPKDQSKVDHLEKKLISLKDGKVDKMDTEMAEPKGDFLEEKMAEELNIEKVEKKDTEME